MIRLIEPNKANFNGVEKRIAGFGSSKNGFFIKNELYEIAKRLNLKPELTWSRTECR